MEQQKSGIPLDRTPKVPFIIKSAVDISKVESPSAAAPVPVTIPGMAGNSARFFEKLSTVIMPNLPAKDLIAMIVRSALEVEFGPSFTLNKNFGKMVDKIADLIMTNPDTRRQALSAASIFIEKKMSMGKKQ